MNLHRHGVVSELVGVNQAAGELVVGIGRQAVVHEELGLGVERFRVSLDQTINFRPGWLGSGDGIGPSQARKILSKTVTGNKPMKVVVFKAESRQVVPASHILAGSG